MVPRVVIRSESVRSLVKHTVGRETGRVNDVGLQRGPTVTRAVRSWSERNLRRVWRLSPTSLTIGIRLGRDWSWNISNLARLCRRRAAERREQIEVFDPSAVIACADTVAARKPAPTQMHPAKTGYRSVLSESPAGETRRLTSRARRHSRTTVNDVPDRLSPVVHCRAAMSPLHDHHP